MSNDFSETVDTLRSKGTVAIKNKSLDQLEDVINVLSELVTASIDLRQRYAPLLRQSQHAESNEIDTLIETQIVSSVQALLDESLEQSDPETVTAVLRSMGSLISVSLKTKSLAIYRSVLSGLERAFATAMTISDKTQRVRILRLLESRLNISAQMDFDIIELNLPEVDLPTLVRFSTTLLKTYQRFLEHVLRSGDPELFKQLLTAFINTLNLPLGHPKHEVDDLQMSLHRNLSGDERRDIETQIGRLQRRQDFYESIAEQKADIVFLLGTAALLVFERSLLVGENFGRVMDSILHYLWTLDRLTVSFIRTRGESDLLPLARFTEPAEMIPSRTIRAGWVDTTPPLRFYILAALSLIRSTDSVESLHQAISTEVDAGELDYLRQQIESSGPPLLDSPVWAHLPMIHSAEGAGEEVVEAPVRELTDRAQRLGRLQEFWVSLVEMRRRDEQQRLVVQPLADSAVQSFKQELVSAWMDHSDLRKLAHELGFYEDLTSQQGPVPERYFGFRQLEPKAWFTEAKGYSASSLGQAVGEGLGRSETNTIVEALIAALVARPMPVANARTVLESFLDALNDGEKKTSAILFGGYSRLQDDLEIARLLKSHPEYRNRIHGYRGHFKDVPVISLARIGAAPPVIIVANMAKLGRLTQYKASDDPKAGLFDCRVESIDEVKARALLAENPELGRPQQNEVITDPVLILQSRVLVTFMERFEFRVIDASAGVRLDLS